jgi:type I restriction enzyme S subunit
MGSEWRELAIGDVCVRVTSGGTPSRARPEYFIGGARPWVKTQELRDCWISDTEEHITDKAIADSSAKLLPAGTVLVAMYGATVGQLGMLAREMTCNQACCALIVDETRADPRFVYYQLLATRSRLISLANGAAQQNLSCEIIKRFRLRFPPLREQRRIADILSALDDKIELNRRTSQTLESMARALFKSWFVDFDPVRAKSEGRDHGLPAFLGDLFPDSIDESAETQVPAGWRLRTVADDFWVTMGQSPPGETYNQDGDGLPFYQGRADFGTRSPSRRVYCTAPTRLAGPGDTLVCVRAPVGDTNLASEECAIGRGLAAVRHKSGASSYTLLMMRSLSDSFAAFESEGTVFGSINKQGFAAMRVTSPSTRVVLAFEQLVSPLDAKVKCANYQASLLAIVRDSLLPVLMSENGRRVASWFGDIDR